MTLLSAPGAGLYAGAQWWKALTDALRAAFPAVDLADLFDCEDSAGAAMAALNIGVRHLVLSPATPGLARIVAIATELGGVILTEAPPALDMAARPTDQALHSWLHLRTA